MNIKKNDQVKIISGAHKGKTGLVVKAFPAKQMVSIEGIGQLTRRFKPTQQKPQGGTKEIHRPIHVGKVELIKSEKDSQKAEKKTKRSKKIKETK